MEKQCAGCGKVFEDGKEPIGQVSPRPYGCCDECNKSTFRSEEGKPSGAQVAGESKPESGNLMGGSTSTVVK